ncbi:Helitron helicase [Phytophthora megakarya]|uniref:ATP-dependent DNA helicase n=1 Tax=Phytophthora megakarya TaxID=4795 RepID=A0A225WF36_9STRA|nr:Helitron helicase [Phytophthora megakarya]
MTHRFQYEALDRTLQDLMKTNMPFGGITMLLCGDFRQTLPVIPRAGPAEVISSTIKHSKIALAATSSGIAATQLMGGRTAHYTFQLGLDLTTSSTCNVTARPNRAELLRQASLIMWDEAPLMIKHDFYAVDRTLRELMKMTSRSGERSFYWQATSVKFFLLSRMGQVKSCIKRSSLRRRFTALHLKQNMRVQRMTDEGTAMET